MKRPPMPISVKFSVAILMAIGVAAAYFAFDMTRESLVHPACDRDFRMAVVTAPIFAVLILVWFANVAAIIRGWSVSRIGIAIWAFMSAAPVIVSSGAGVPLTLGKFFPLLATAIPGAMLFLPTANRWFKACGEFEDAKSGIDANEAIERLKVKHPDFLLKDADEQMRLIRDQMDSQGGEKN